MPDSEMSKRLADMFEGQARQLANQLADGSMSLLDWHIEMRELIRQSYALQLIAGAGGDKSKVSNSDWLKLGSQVRSQYGYLEDFAGAIGRGELTADQIASRAEMYMRSGRQMYWRQLTGDRNLPAYPADGSSECLSNCGCEWVEVDGKWYWVRGKDDSCPTCIYRDSAWSPYEFTDGDSEEEYSLDLSELRRVALNRADQLRILHELEEMI